MKKILLPYGDSMIEAPRELAGLPVLDAPGLPEAGDPAGVIDAAASEASARVARMLGSNDRVGLVVPDRTRPLPLPLLLPPLLGALAEQGVAPERVTLIPASGIHRPMSLEELRAWIGDRATGTDLRLVPHDADGPSVDLGTTKSGIAVAGNPEAAKAGALLLLGRIVFHYLAGFGGGRKMIAPGVSARSTILAVHGRCLSETPGGGRHEAARTGRLSENPVHEAACEAAKAFPPSLCIHFHLTTKGVLSDMVVGDPFSDHERECARYAGAYRASVAAPLDGVIVSAGGEPLDGDLVQAHKALDAVAPIVRVGGTVVLVARCGQGPGNPEVLEALRLGGPEAIEEALRADFRVGRHTALALREKTSRLKVYALTGLPDGILEAAGMGRVRSLEEAVRILSDRHETLEKTALAPRGASLLYEVLD